MAEGVFEAQTCKWEPYCGRKAHTAFEYCLDESIGVAHMSEPATHVDAVAKHRHYLAEHGASTFFTPFVGFFLLALPGTDDLHKVCLNHLSSHWGTYYGVSRVVNEALGTNLPEKPRSRQCSEISYGFYASFLFFSDFGQAVADWTLPGEPAV